MRDLKFNVTTKKGDLKFNVTTKKGDLTSVKISEIGKLKAFDNKKKVLSYLVECDTKGERIHFIFYNSIAFTEQQDLKKGRIGMMGLTKDEKKDLIYSVLACIEILKWTIMVKSQP